MSTWFKLYREIFDSDLWHDVTTFRLFLLLLGKASHQDGVKIAGIELKRGQYLRSYRKLAEDLAYKEGRGTKSYSLKTIKKCVDKLVRDERVNVQETEQGTLFTILNYNKYQGSPSDKEETGNTIGSVLETNGKLTGNNNNNANNAYKDISSSSSNDEEFAEVMNFYQMNLQKGVTESPYNYELIDQWYEEWGSELLLAAMKLAAQREAKGTSFVEGVLKNWKNAGVKTVDDARKHETEFRNQKRNPYKNNVVPLKNREPQYDDYDYGF